MTLVDTDTETLQRLGRLTPQDGFNERLLRQVHPPDWHNPEPAARYNLVVIGGGTAGLVAAIGGAGLGAKVALVERHLLGGDCLNVGCVPSKTLIRSARAAAELRNAARYGVRAPAPEVDFAAVMERVRRVRADLSPHDSAARLRDLGVDVFLGEARFAGRDAVEVAGRRLRFARAVIATGARAVVPPIPGLDETGYRTNETIFNLTERPRRLLVLGGGPLGCELAQAFARLGSEVDVVARGAQFLPREDPDAAACLAEALRRDGVRFHLETEVRRVERADGAGRALIARGSTETWVPFDELLIGFGRAPNVEGLGLEAAGVAYDARAGVRVDDRLRTANPRIYAAGDVGLAHRFTHMADAAARIVLRNALFMGRARLSALTVPWCTYTAPEIAHVGLYEHEAAARGIAVRTLHVPLADVDRAVTDGDTDGFVKIHVRAGSDRIVGATIVADHAGEMISEITLAMVAGVGLGRIAGVIHPYPTQAEAIRKAADAYNRTRLTPFVKKVFETWLAWWR